MTCGAPLGYAGPAVVTFGGTDLGYHENLVFNATEEFQSVMVTQHGKTPIDIIRSGSTATCEVDLKGPTLAQLAAALPDQLDVTLNEGIFSSGAGVCGSTNAATLIIKPVEDGVATVDATRWITVAKAVPTINNASFAFNNDDQRVFPVLFTGLAVLASDTTLISGGWAVSDIWAIGFGENA